MPDGGRGIEQRLRGAASAAKTYGVDTRGNPTSAVTSANAGTCDAYDQARRLTAISIGTGASCSMPTTGGTYTCNAARTPMSKSVGATTTQFAWAGSALLQEKSGSTMTWYTDGPGGMPLELITPTGTPYYYQHDQLGSTRALVDATGTVQATDTYDPHGNLTASKGSVMNPLLYAGHQAARGSNWLGSHFGPVGSEVSHVVALPLTVPEGIGLGEDVGIDWFKNHVLGNGEAVNDEQITGGILPRFLAGGGPQTHLPGWGKCGVDFEW